MRGLFKRGKTFWIRFAGPDGRIIRESTGSSNFKDAQKVLTKRKHEASEYQPSVLGDILFKDLAKEYHKWAERQRCYRTKKGFIAQLSAVFGEYPLKDLSPILIEAFQTERIRKGNKPATVNRLVSTIKHMVTKAVEWRLVGDDVHKRIRKVKHLEENNRRLRYLSKKECQSLIVCCPNHLKPIVITALNSGMRKSEVLTLTWDRVDLNNGFILLEKTKSGRPREIPINTTLNRTLTELPRADNNPHVFNNPGTGKPYQDIRNSFATACKNAGIKDFQFHDLRHTFASHLVMAGVDIPTVKELLGHQSLEMTLRYAHLAPSHKVKAVEILDETLTNNI